jgi:CheY-like chemotaxis protein
VFPQQLFSTESFSLRIGLFVFFKEEFSPAGKCLAPKKRDCIFISPSIYPARFSLPMKQAKRVLLIDDDEINTFICIKNIKDSGFAESTTYCRNGLEGLEELKDALESRPEDLPDVIFLDINMPKMKAWQFLDAYAPLSERFPKEVKLFILSSSVYRKDVEKSTHYQTVSDYLIKPLSLETLQELRVKYF